MKPMAKRVKMDIGLVPQAVNNTNVTGSYFHMARHRKALAVGMVGAMAAATTADLEFLQATDAAGTSAKAVTGAKATITANTAVTVATLTLATVLNTQAVTINGLTFTAHTDTTTKSARQFAISGDDTADAAELVKCINDATYGVPGITATSALGVVTLVSTLRGDTAITITNPAATITPATTQAISYVELDVSQLDLANGFEYVAAKVTTGANTVAGVVLLRGDSRFEPSQVVGAGKVL